MADKTIKHFVIIRFFNLYDPNYPHDIFDVNFLSKQLVLAQNNALKSLGNQTNKNFEVVFVLHEKFFSETKYEFIFSTLRDSIDVPVKFVNNKDRLSFYKDSYDSYDFVIQSGMDFDDFIFKDAIADIQSKTNECSNILGYGYCKGYDYRNKELYSYSLNYKNQGVPFILMSLIVRSSFAERISDFTIYQFRHNLFKSSLKEFLEKNGVEFSEKKYQTNTTTDAWIYFRHEFSHYVSTRSEGKVRTLKLPTMTTKDITKKQLKEEFGFTGYELKSIKDEETDFDYDFTSTKEEFVLRQDLRSIKWIE